MSYWIKEGELNFFLYFRRKLQSGCGGFLAMLVPESPSLKPQVKHLDLESCDTYNHILPENRISLPASFCGSHSKMLDFSYQQQPRCLMESREFHEVEDT